MTRTSSSRPGGGDVGLQAVGFWLAKGQSAKPTLPPSTDKSARPFFLLGRLSRRRGRPPLPDLLAPHGVVEPLLRDKIVVLSGLDDAASLENVDAIGMQDGRETVCDEDGDGIAGRRDLANRLDDAFLCQGVQ